MDIGISCLIMSGVIGLIIFIYHIVKNVREIISIHKGIESIEGSDDYDEDVEEYLKERGEQK